MNKLKLGLIVECTPVGLESVVCPKILQLLAKVAGLAIEYRIRTMTNKKFLIQDAGKTTALLLGEGCDRVVILWDENPPWTPEADFADERCWHVEREQLLKNLMNPKVDPRIALVCIEREFETWLLHDHQLLSAVISTPAHPAKVRRQSDPALIDRPKRHLISLFRKHKAHYNPDVAARKFALCLESLTQFKRCDTFRYFVQSIFGVMPNGWEPYTYKLDSGENCQNLKCFYILSPNKIPMFRVYW